MLKLSKYPPKGFTLIELLVVVLIIGILAAIALPKYQLAVDKAKFANIMTISKALRDAQSRSDLVGKPIPKIYETDFDIPEKCDIINSASFSCDGGTWGCYLYSNVRCSDLSINATYFNAANGEIVYDRWFCCAHTFDEHDRANRLCQSITGKTTPTPQSLTIFTGETDLNCYHFW